MTEKTYAVGDEFGDGVVTRVGTNNGHTEYTVAVEDKNNDRPIDIGPKVHPAAFTEGPVELAAENQKTYDAVKKESEEADKKLAEENKEEGLNANPNDAKAVRKETVTPDPKTTPAGNASAAKTAAK